MPRIFIDTDELQSISSDLLGEAAELGQIALALTGAWARTPAPPLQLLTIGAHSGWAQARMTGLAAQLGAASASLRVEAVAVELSEIDPRYYDLVEQGGRPFVDGLLELLDGKAPHDWLNLLALAMGGGAGAFISLAAGAGDTISTALDIVKTVKDVGSLTAEVGSEVGSVVAEVSPFARFLGVAGIGLAAYDAVSGWDNIFKREKTDRPAGVEAAQDATKVVGSGLMAIGGTVMLIPGGQVVGGAIFVVGGGLKLAASAVDAGYYLKQHSTEIWKDARKDWKATSDFVGHAAEGAISGAKHAVGSFFSGGKKLFGLG